MESTKALSARFTDLFNNGDRTKAETLLAPQINFHGGSAGEFTTRDELFDMISGYRATFPDAHSTVDDQIAEGDRVVTRWTATGTGPNDKRYVLHGITIERIEDGQIAEVWMNRDDVAMQRQLS
ncbi:MAG: hypothetical protein JWQ32_1325 [Marmoricola sp.]|nr:hypothetical protein [Marmoricola sp.]